MNKILTIIAFFAMTSLAFADNFTVDQTYTTVGFRIKHLMGHAVGVIKKYDGQITLDKDNKSLQGIEATLDMTTIDTKNADRDEDLKSDRFFDVAKFPQATFKSKTVDDKKVVGDLTLKGVTKEVSLDYKFLGTATDQHGRFKAGVELTGSFNRKDFGITYNTKTDDGKLLLGDEVELRIEVQGILKK